MPSLTLQAGVVPRACCAPQNHRRLSPCSAPCTARSTTTDTLATTYAHKLNGRSGTSLHWPIRRCSRRQWDCAAPRASAATTDTLPAFTRACNSFTSLFPLWVALGAVVGLTIPSAVTWFKGSMITYALAVTMLGMGLGLDASDFKTALTSPRVILIGVALQYTVMPFLAFALSRALPIPTPFAVGLILVGCCPGGTASNLVTYIARADVALSVVLTACSTALAAIATPALTSALAGQLVPVPAASLVASTAQVVILPVALGLLLRRYAPAAVAAVGPACPPIAVATVALICASVIGTSSAAIRSAGPLLLLAVALLHSGGFALGLGLAKAAGFSKETSRTISIEVGMQNSALGVVLALAHFADPLTAVPCAVSATAHSCIGSGLAAYWRSIDASEEAPRPAVAAQS